MCDGKDFRYFCAEIYEMLQSVLLQQGHNKRLNIHILYHCKTSKSIIMQEEELDEIKETTISAEDQKQFCLEIIPCRHFRLAVGLTV